MAFFEKLLHFFQSPGIFLSSLLATGLLLLYYFRLLSQNRHEGSPSLVPREEPPQQLSPAAARYIWINEFDSDCLIAGIMDAVVKDCYRIKWRDNSFSIYLNPHAILDKLSEDEKAALSFNPRHYLERLSVSSQRNRFTRRAEDRMQDYLKKRYQKFLLKVPFLVLYGLIFSLLSSCLIHVLFEQEIPFVVYAAYFLFILPLTGVFTYGAYYAFSIKNWAAFPFGVALSVVGLIIMGHIESGFSHFLWPTLLPMLMVNGIFFSVLPRHTPKGHQLKDQIDEFREFLIARVTNDRAFERSEFYLIPYMVALEVPFSNSQYFAPLLSEEKRGNYRSPFSPF